MLDPVKTREREAMLKLICVVAKCGDHAAVVEYFS